MCGAYRSGIWRAGCGRGGLRGGARRARAVVRRQRRERVEWPSDLSKISLAEPLALDDGASVDLIELIAPFHQRVYRMGLEHLGFVVGDDFDEFSRRHRVAPGRCSRRSL
jgi:hypothetical protein